MRKKMVAGNWKMYTQSGSARTLAQEVVAGARDVPNVDVVLCPPFPYLGLVADVVRGSNVALGAQNAFLKAEGAFTGEVSPAMLKDVGCRYVILGHSERRHLLGETDEQVHDKASLCLATGLEVILCVGETLQERQAGQTEPVVLRQLTTGVQGFAADQFSRITIAYEPVWAIGTGHTATPEQAQAVHKVIRQTLGTIAGRETADALRILYGGSVKADNAAALFAEPDIDGGLVGGASLKASDFLAIVRAARG